MISNFYKTILSTTMKEYYSSLNKSTIVTVAASLIMLSSLFGGTSTKVLSTKKLTLGISAASSHWISLVEYYSTVND